jgi:hypothetical protein
MSVMARPTILIVDDELRDADNLVKSIGKAAEVVVRSPDDFTKTDLRDSDLVLVDYKLTDWEGAEAGLTAPSNGLALSAVIREQIRALGGREVTGVALYSGEVDAISGTIPNEVRGFVVARLNNLEWVFEKDDRDAYRSVISLATALKSLPRTWPEDSTKATKSLHHFLGLDSAATFFETADQDIEACHPPIHELSNASHALAVIRWMAHRILPYPAFLTDQIGLAARLRIQVTDLAPLLAEKSKLSAALKDARYTGELCELFGPHWWRSGIDNLIFEWTSGSGDMDALHATVNELAGKQLRLYQEDVVPVIDESYRAKEIAAIETAVRLRPDDWPVFADEAWAKRDVVAEFPRLQGLVVPADRALVSD